MDLPLSLVTESFNPPAARLLDFDSVGSPRTLRPRPVGADASAEANLRADLAWFWNSNAEWADDQIAVGESYPDLVRRLILPLGFREGDRIVLCASEPDDRRAAWKAALPEGVEISDWRPRRLGRVLLRDLEALVNERTRLVMLTQRFLEFRRISNWRRRGRDQLVVGRCVRGVCGQRWLRQCRHYPLRAR